MGPPPKVINEIYTHEGAVQAWRQKSDYAEIYATHSQESNLLALLALYLQDPQFPKVTFIPFVQGSKQRGGIKHPIYFRLGCPKLQVYMQYLLDLIYADLSHKHREHLKANQLELAVLESLFQALQSTSSPPQLPLSPVFYTDSI